MAEDGGVSVGAEVNGVESIATDDRRDSRLRVLELFAGAGGGILGSRLLGHRVVCAVERDPYCREILLRRQEEGHLEPFPVWDDVRTFDGRPWRGLVDCVSAGFPCQRFSTATRGRATAADLFDEVARIVAEVEPRYIHLENVLPKAFPGEWREDLCEVSAAAVGAPIERSRQWLVAVADDEEQRGLRFDAEVARQQTAPRVRWWEDNPASVLGVPDGISPGMDRARAIGNAQVPAVARAAFLTLNA